MGITPLISASNEERDLEMALGVIVFGFANQMVDALAWGIADVLQRYGANVSQTLGYGIILLLLLIIGGNWVDKRFGLGGFMVVTMVTALGVLYYYFPLF